MLLEYEKDGRVHKLKRRLQAASAQPGIGLCHHRGSPRPQIRGEFRTKMKCFDF